MFFYLIIEYFDINFLELIHRYFEALRTKEFDGIDTNLQQKVFNWFHLYKAMYVACDSWYEASCRNYLEYIDCPGDLLLDWKDKGYRTVFDLLQVKNIILK